METIEVSIDEKWAAVVRSPLYHVVAALTGVAVTFLPLLLYQYGRDGVEPGDWRVIAMLVTIVLVTLVHFRLSAPVMKALREGMKQKDKQAT